MQSIKCFAQYTDIRKQMYDVLERQQQIFEKINLLGCHKEFANFMLKSREIEFERYKEEYNEPISLLCVNTMNYINNKNKLLNKLEKVTSCHELVSIFGKN